MARGPVVIDLSPAQSPEYAERGIARHTVEFAKAMVARHPDLVGRLLVDPHRLPLPGIEDWAACGAIPLDRWQPRRSDILHLISPFELDQPLDRMWPRAATGAGTRLVVTVHDLIPEVMSEDYLSDPGLRRRWRARRSLVRTADRVLTLSRSGRSDVIEYLDIPEERVALIGAGCSAQFVAPEDRLRARETARRTVADLGERFVVYNGGADPRKNLERLLVAWAHLMPQLRDQHQLVIVCRLSAPSAHHYRRRAEDLGIAASVLFTGLVSDAALVGLYQTTELMVFPSLYEGYGLPVVEALACGAPVIAAATSCLVELVAPEATFDPLDPVAMAAAITRGLSDVAYRRRLAAAAGQPPPTWGDAADRAAAVYRSLAADPAPDPAPAGAWPSSSRRPGRAERPLKLAMILPAGSSPWAGPDAELAGALAEATAEVDCFGDPADHRRLSTRSASSVGPVAPLSTLGAASAVRAGYDAVILTLGAHPGHLQALAWLRSPHAAAAGRIVVVARERSLVGLHRSGPPGAFAREWHAHYPAAPLSPPDPAPGLMVRRAVEASDLYLVNSRQAAAEVRGELPPELVGRVVVAPGNEASRAAKIVASCRVLPGGR